MCELVQFAVVDGNIVKSAVSFDNLYRGCAVLKSQVDVLDNIKYGEQVVHPLYKSVLHEFILQVI